MGTIKLSREVTERKRDNALEHLMGVRIGINTTNWDFFSSYDFKKKGKNFEIYGPNGSLVGIVYWKGYIEVIYPEKIDCTVNPLVPLLRPMQDSLVFASKLREMSNQIVEIPPRHIIREYMRQFHVDAGNILEMIVSEMRQGE